MDMASSMTDLPPVDVPVIATSWMWKGEREVVRVFKQGAVRWKILRFMGRPSAFPIREWHPDSWRFKDEMARGP
jgi:hypothetical protein